MYFSMRVNFIHAVIYLQEMKKKSSEDLVTMQENIQKLKDRQTEVKFYCLCYMNGMLLKILFTHSDYFTISSWIQDS